MFFAVSTTHTVRTVYFVEASDEEQAWSDVRALTPNVIQVEKRRISDRDFENQIEISEQQYQSKKVTGRLRDEIDR